MVNSYFYCWLAPTASTARMIQTSSCKVVKCMKMHLHDLHILVTAPFCCDCKAWAASAQSFILWQQATTEITHPNHFINACSRHIYMDVILCAHPVRDESYIPRKSNWKHPLLFTTNCTSRMFTFYEDGTCMTFTSWSQHHFVAIRKPERQLHKASHWQQATRDHAPWSLCYCLFVPRIYGCYTSRTSQSWWITHSTQHQLRDCNTIQRSYCWFILIIKVQNLNGLWGDQETFTYTLIMISIC